MTESACPYVSRAGMKLAAALRAFELDVDGGTCLDLGCHVGGFVDCLLQHGAAKVYAVDPGYGVLDYQLRKDPRVVVCERSNALRYECPERCDLISIDVGWTQIRLVLPPTARNLAPSGSVVGLVKPQYEAPKDWLEKGIVPADRMDEVLATCRHDFTAQGWRIDGEIESPIRGHGGNVEYLWLLRPE